MKKAILSFLFTLALFLGYAQNTAEKPTFWKGITKTVGINYAYSTSDVGISQGFVPNTTIGGFNDFPNGGEIYFGLAKQVHKRIGLEAKIGPSLMGRRWDGISYKHWGAMVDFGTKIKVLHPVSLAGGLRVNQLFKNDAVYKLNKTELFYRYGLDVQFPKGVSLSVFQTKAINPYYSFKTDQADYSFDVFRTNTQVGIQYGF